MFISWKAGGLNYKGIMTSNILINFYLISPSEKVPNSIEESSLFKSFATSSDRSIQDDPEKISIVPLLIFIWLGW